MYLSWRHGCDIYIYIDRLCTRLYTQNSRLKTEFPGCIRNWRNLSAHSSIARWSIHREKWIFAEYHQTPLTQIFLHR